MILGARQWFDVHSFTGVFAGVMLFVICWSGTVATLSSEIDWLVTPELRVQPFEGDINWDFVVRAVRHEFPNAQIQILRMPQYQRSAIEVAIKRDGEPRTNVFVDPSNNEILGVGSMATVQRFFRSFHRRLFYPNPLGIVFVSLFALGLAVSIVSALNFYKRWWTKLFRFKPGKKKAWATEVHKTGGLWALLFGVLISITGVWYGLEATGLPHFLFGAEQSSSAGTEVGPAPALTINELTTIAQRARPQLQIRQIFPPGSFFGEDRLRVAGRGDDYFLRDHANSVTVHENGTLVAQQRGADLDPFQYWVNMADPLHFGTFAGLVSKAFWFVFGLLLCGLCLSGIYLHGKRLSRQGGLQGRAYKRGTCGALILTLIFMLGSVYPGVSEMLGYLGTHDPQLEDVPMAYGVMTFIIGWVLITTLLIALCYKWILRH